MTKDELANIFVSQLKPNIDAGTAAYLGYIAGFEECEDQFTSPLDGRREIKYDLRFGAMDGRDMVLSKFSKEFLAKHYNHDGFFMVTISRLMAGAHPYKLIEDLLVIRMQLDEQVLQLFQNRDK